MNTIREKKEFFWKAAAVIVIGAFAVQSLITYHVLTREKSNEPENAEYEEIQLTPRNVNIYQPQAGQQGSRPQNSQALAPQPIPKLNVNVNSLPGVKPSTTFQAQQQQYPQKQLMPGGMNININQNPFGMNMMEEMAKMEEMMNQMMGRNGMSMNMRMPSSRMGSMSMGGGYSPAITVDSNNNYVVSLKIPDLDKSEVKARVNGNMLSISGVQRKESSTNAQGGNSYVTSYSSFQNSFSLPGPGKAEGMKVDYEDDTLTVKVPQA